MCLDETTEAPCSETSVALLSRLLMGGGEGRALRTPWGLELPFLPSPRGGGIVCPLLEGGRQEGTS